MSRISFTCAPALVFYAWAVAEVVRFVLRRRAAPDGVAGTWSKIAVFAWRPWAVWAGFNLFCRVRAEHGFGHPPTFPLYALCWRTKRMGWNYLVGLAQDYEFWIWSGAVLCLLFICILLGRLILRRTREGWVATACLLAALCVTAFALWSSVACLPRGARLRGPRDPGSYLLVWHTGAGTFLYNMPHIQSTRYFMRNFERIQPQLRHTIHGVTHPPGAALSLYWIGKFTGAEPARIRENDVKVRYALGLTAAATLNLVPLFFLGWGMFRSVRVGLLTALLWLVSPAATAYSQFSQDPIYAIFFHGALAGTWFTVTGRRSPAVAAGLGCVFFVLTLMAFSWCLVTTMFALFAVCIGVRDRWSRRDVAVRGLLPLTVMTLLAGAVLWGFRLNYLAIYRFAHAYHVLWYRYTGAYQWCLALLGGQLELLLMMGTVSSSLCVARLRRGFPRPLSAPALFALIVLGVYAIPIFFGPNPLKMETARCWIWILSLPVAFSARQIARSARPVAWGVGAVTAAIAASYIMRLFINFGA